MTIEPDNRGNYVVMQSSHIDNLDHSSLYPSMNHKIDLMDSDKDRKELREAIRLMLEEEEYFTGSDISNYCVTTAYLQDTSEMILRDLADRIQEEFRRRGDQMAAKKVDYTKEINTDRPIKKDIGKELVYAGRLETDNAYLLDILKENGFYLIYTTKETKFGELEYWQVLYPKED